MTMRHSKADRAVLSLCRTLGLTDATIQTGKKHRKLVIGGRAVHVLSHGTKNETGDKGLRFVESTIRRIAKERDE